MCCERDLELVATFYGNLIDCCLNLDCAGIDKIRVIIEDANFIDLGSPVSCRRLSIGNVFTVLPT